MPELSIEKAVYVLIGKDTVLTLGGLRWSEDAYLGVRHAFRNYWLLISADTEISIFLAIVAGALIPSILGFNIKS